VLWKKKKASRSLRAASLFPFYYRRGLTILRDAG
jgi:hypothetical protein